MNLEIRSEILSNSLSLEDNLNKILSRLIKVKSSEPKTLGHKSSAIPFITKVNLLYDLERISKEEYNKLTCFMEIRNQFIHNLDADTFDKVLSRISKRNLFLDIDIENKEKLKKAKDPKEREELLKVTYRQFYSNLLALIIAQYENLIELEKSESNRKVQEEQLRMYEDMYQSLTESIEEGINLFEESVNKSFNRETGFAELIKRGISGFFDKKMCEKYPDLAKSRENEH